MRRIFINQSNIRDERIILTGEKAHYLRTVLRIKTGNQLEAIDSASHARYETVISTITKETIEATITNTKQTNTSGSLLLTVIQGLPKGSKMDLIIQKCTEIGAHAFYPLISRRAIPDIAAKKLEKVARWQKISEEAAKQSQRLDIPDVYEPVSTADLATIYSQHDLNLILWEGEQGVSIKQELTGIKPQSVSVTIGPEGGFEQAEVEKMTAIGGRPVTIGRSILRTETAGIAVCAMIMYELTL